MRPSCGGSRRLGRPGRARTCCGAWTQRRESAGRWAGPQSAQGGARPPPRGWPRACETGRAGAPGQWGAEAAPPRAVKSGACGRLDKRGWNENMASGGGGRQHRGPGSSVDGSAGGPRGRSAGHRCHQGRGGCVGWSAACGARAQPEKWASGACTPVAWHTGERSGTPARAWTGQSMWQKGQAGHRRKTRDHFQVSKRAGPGTGDRKRDRIPGF